MTEQDQRIALSEWIGCCRDTSSLDAKPHAGQFRRFITEAKDVFQTICVWYVGNVTLDAALRRYDFTPETEIDGTGEVLIGFRWDAEVNNSRTTFPLRIRTPSV